MQYNKSMGGVDLANMLLALYRINVKTRHWYIKVSWHLVDIAKVNGWILYWRHYAQNSLPPKDKLSLSKFSTKLSEALIHTNKPSTSRGRPNKRACLENLLATKKKKGGRKAAVPTPFSDIRYDSIGHWPSPLDDKKRSRQCQAYCRRSCSKCNLSLYLTKESNCFVKFHGK